MATAEHNVEKEEALVAPAAAAAEGGWAAVLPPVLRASLALLPSPEAQRAREVCSGWRAAVPAARYTRVPGSAVSGLEPDFHILWMTVLPDGHVSNRKGYHVKAHNTRALWRDDLTQELVDLTMVERSDKVLDLPGKDTVSDHEYVVKERSRVQDCVLARRALRHPQGPRLREAFLTSRRLVIVAGYSECIGGRDAYLLDYVQEQGSLSVSASRALLLQMLSFARCSVKELEASSLPYPVLLSVMRESLVEAKVLSLRSGLVLRFGHLSHIPLNPIRVIGNPTINNPPPQEMKLIEQADKWLLLPEDLLRKKDCGRVLERKVAWLCGAMLYIMLYGRLPYIDGRLNLRDFVNRTRAVDLVVPDGHHQLPPLLHDLLRGALDSNPETRSSLDAIEVHPWCNSGEEGSGHGGLSVSAQPCGAAPDMLRGDHEVEVSCGARCIQSEEEIRELFDASLAIADPSLNKLDDEDSTESLDDEILNSLDDLVVDPLEDGW